MCSIHLSHVTSVFLVPAPRPQLQKGFQQLVLELVSAGMDALDIYIITIIIINNNNNDNNNNNNNNNIYIESKNLQRFLMYIYI